MKKLLINGTFFVSTVFAYLIGVVYFLPVDQDSFIGEIVEHHRNLETVPQPRIIIVGGSSVGFATDSEMIEKATGQHVINMGFHGGLGLSFYSHEIKASMKKGDTIIAAFESQLLATPDLSGGAPIVEVTIFYPKAFMYLDLKNIKAYFDYLPITFQRRLRGFFTTRHKDAYFYRRSGFNKYGDYVGHLNVPPKVEMSLQVVSEKLAPEVRELFLDLRDFCAKKGAHLYIAFDPLLVEKGNEKKLKDFKAKQELLYKDMLTMNIPIIGHPSSYLYPEDYFWDTIYHLNGKGREIKTRQMINDMKQYPELFVK